MAKCAAAIFSQWAKDLDEEVLERGYDSVSSDDSDGGGLEYAFEDASDGESEASFGDGANMLGAVDFA